VAQIILGRFLSTARSRAWPMESEGMLAFHVLGSIRRTDARH
jgi:hypothetical protein